MKHVNKILAGLITCCVILLLSGCSPRQGEKHDFSIGKGTFLLDGKPFVIKAAEIHYTRIPAEYWQHRIQMCKALGMNTICIYAFWNIHEQKPGEFDFKGQNDIAAFCRLAQKEGMYIMLRPGPYSATDDANVHRFQKELEALGVNATVRRRLGTDISAACGQLRREDAQGK